MNILLCVFLLVSIRSVMARRCLHQCTNPPAASKLEQSKMCASMKVFIKLKYHDVENLRTDPPFISYVLSDCKDLRNDGYTSSGVYTIQISTGEEVQVYCDMVTDGGGWTVFQYRFDGTVHFNTTFAKYEFGFGNLNGEFWLGLHYIYHLTRDPTELRIDLTAADDSTGYETFQSFSISAEPLYTLSVSSPGGSISDSTKGLMYNNGGHFSTFDRDLSGYNCAELDHGGWWYHYCAYANLNGFYGIPGSTDGFNGYPEAAMTYRSFKFYESLKTSKMMIRRT